jgi:hypothetical protein
MAMTTNSSISVKPGGFAARLDARDLDIGRRMGDDGTNILLHRARRGASAKCVFKFIRFPKRPPELAVPPASARTLPRGSMAAGHQPSS